MRPRPATRRATTVAQLRHQPQHAGGQRQPSAAPSTTAFRRVGDEHPRRHLVEAEAALDAEGAVAAERQVDRRRQHRASSAISATPRAMPPGANAAAASVVQPLQAAAERQHQDARRIERRGRSCRSGFWRAVIRGLLVRRPGRFRSANSAGTRVAVRLDVARRGACEPQPQSGGERERGKKQDGESVHGMRAGLYPMTADYDKISQTFRHETYGTGRRTT